MTTITYRDKVMASDSRAYTGGSTPIGWKQKIHRTKDGGLLGVSTTIPGLSEAFVAWAQKNFDPEFEPNVPDHPTLSALYVDPNGQVFYWGDSMLKVGPIEAEYFAIGSGEHYALGAMAMGAPAMIAVQVAKQFDVWTDGEIQNLSLEP